MDETECRFAFTLAEILITLSIIGVVAALTIPSLIVSNQEKETVVQLKKVYNVFSNAFSLAVVEYGEPSGWGWGNENSLQGSKNIMNLFSNFLNIIKICNGTEKGCFPSNVMYKKLSGTNAAIFDGSPNKSSGVLFDGTIFTFYSLGTNCQSKFGTNPLTQNICGTLLVDVNGQKNPNVYGKDTFQFLIATEGITPMGLENTDTSGVETCEKEGSSCTAWVLLKENMNYPPYGTGWD